jgi:hypothetical protein
MEIHLSPKLTPQHTDAIAKYLARRASLSAAEWKVALQAFDVLRSSLVIHHGVKLTFNTFYNRTIDHQFGDEFIAELLTLVGINEAPHLLRKYQQMVIGELTSLGLMDDGSDDARCLTSFCLYW